jgi:integrase/recombinase XerC
MSSAIVSYSGGSALQRSRSWTAIPPDARKRRAAEACRDREADELVSLLHAYIIQRGSAGAHVSKHTLRNYGTSVRILLDHWQGENLLHPSDEAGFTYVRTLEDAGLKPGTVQVRLAGARMLYQALRWTRVTDVDPFADVKAARDKRPRHTLRDPYPETSLQKLLAIAEGEDRALVLLGYHAALRVSEIVKLKWVDVDLAAHRLTVVEGKGRKTAPVEMSNTLTETLEALPRQNDYVISAYRSPEQARRHMAALCQRADVRYQACHSLRHSSGTKLQAQLNDLQRTARHLRHSSTATTEVYVHMADDVLKNSVGEW